jgi:hypothetical protein
MFYLHAPMDTCVKRNEGRIFQESTEEEGFVPPDVLETYYRDDDVDQLNEKFAEKLVQIDNGQDGVALLSDEIKYEISKKLESVLIR